MFAVVDDDDYQFISQWKWRADRSSTTFYAARSERGKRVRMHRQILGLQDGEVGVDHKNRNGLDNRRGNLRRATQSQNCFNRDFRKCNKSGEIGVFWHKAVRGWRSKIQVNGRQIWLGYFKNKSDAIRARREATKKYFGEFAPS